MLDVDLAANVFAQIAALLVLCAALGVVASVLRQPLIVAFIVAGILAGPVGFGLVDPEGEIEILAQIGVAVLLFVVGLKLDVRMVRDVGPVALATGLGQVAFTSAAGWLIVLALGFDAVAALYVAVALTFSSTIIIVKLLSDKKEVDSLYGRIAIGFLIVQDICVVLAMIALTAIGEPGETDLAAEGVRVVVAGLGLLVGLYALSRFVLPALEHRLARSPELMVLFAIAWAVALAALSDALGFSEEVGAFLAGVSLASSAYRDVIGSRLANLRDFLLLFFFVSLGAQLDFGPLADLLGAALLLSGFVLVGNPLIVMAIMGLMGYRAGVSFRAGLTVAQISEFSLILAALGASLGQIDQQVVALITIVGLITITTSTYLIVNADWLFERLQPVLRLFERDMAVHDANTSADPDGPRPDVVVIGAGRYGGELIERLQRRGWVPMAVDYDPVVLRHWEARDVAIRYADAGDVHLSDLVPLDAVHWVISTVRDADTNRTLLQILHNHGYRGMVALAADHPGEVDDLRASGATVVLRPFTDAALTAVEMIEDHEEPHRPHGDKG